MNKDNLIKNGGFAEGKLEPWVASGKGVGVFEEGNRHYVRIAPGSNIQQNPDVPTVATVLEFQARTRESLSAGQSILFIASLFIQLAEGIGGPIHLFGGLVSLDEWQSYTFKIPQYDTAVMATLSITPLGATDARRLLGVEDVGVGTVEFRTFSLSAIA